MYRYSDYLKINKEYYEFFTEEADNKNSSYWKLFIPHEDMKAFVSSAFDAIEREKDPQSLWLHGTYGTGKTHVLFLLKHMLEDPWKNVETYLKANNRRLGNIPNRLQAIRERGDGLVVFLSSSSHLNTTRKLLAEIQIAIRTKLQSKGYKSTSDTVCEEIIKKISSDGSVIDWNKVFKKNRLDKFGEYENAQQIVDALKSFTESRTKGGISLVENVAMVLEEEGIMLHDTPASIKKWIKDAIRSNDLKYLIVIWDEFTDYFSVNSTLTGLQELAHLTSEVPFYLILATHRAPKQINQYVEGSWKKLIDRFQRIPYTMRPVTAYRLMSQSIKPGHDDEKWNEIQEKLWIEVNQCATHIMKTEGIEPNLNDIKTLIPIHPYAAYLVSKISSQFSSSQRTLFKFLRTNEKGSFSEFIEEHPNTNCKWYTTERLWDYYFLKQTEDLSEGFKQVVSYVNSRQNLDELPETTLRVFKGIVTLIALSREISDTAGISPNLNNLRWLFNGTSVAKSLDDDLNTLKAKDLIRTIQESADKVSLIIPTGGIDLRKIESYSRKQSYSELAAEGGKLGSSFLNVFQGETVLERRLALKTLSGDDCIRKRGKAVLNYSNWQIPTLCVLPKNTAQLMQVNNRIKEFSKLNEGNLYIIVQTPFSDERWGSWCDNKAYEQWYRENSDSSNQQHHSENAKRQITEWYRLSRSGKFTLYYNGIQMSSLGALGLRNVITEEVIQRKFPYRPELINSTATLYATSYGESAARDGLSLSEVSGQLSIILRKIESDNMWPSSVRDLSKYKTHPEHLLSKMHKVIVDAYDKNDSVSLQEIWKSLSSAPYGLIPSKIGIYLFGFILAGFVDGYHYEDGSNTFPLDRTKLGKLLKDVMSRNKDYNISRTSKEEVEFCALISTIFNINPNNAKYPQQVIRELREKISLDCYPLWLLKKSCIQDHTEAAIVYLISLLSDTEKNSQKLSVIPIKENLSILRIGGDELRELYSIQNLRKAMKDFIDLKAQGTIEIAENSNIGLSNIMDLLKKLLQGEVWLWKEDEVADKLLQIRKNLRMNAAINMVTGKQSNEIDQARVDLIGCIQRTKLPCIVMESQCSDELKDLINVLYDFAAIGNVCVESTISLLQNNHRALREMLRSPARILHDWYCQKTSDTVSRDEINTVHKGMCDLSSEQSEDAIISEIALQLSMISKQKHLNSLKAQWKRLTASDGPVQWEKSHNIPIKWIIPDGLHSIIEVLARPDRANDEEVESALELLKESSEKVKSLLDSNRYFLIFLNSLIMDYSNWITEKFLEEEIRNELHKSLGDDLSRWDRNSVKRKLQEIRQDNYQEHIKESILEKLEGINEGQMRVLLKELIDDPQIGLRLLSIIELEH